MGGNRLCERSRAQAGVSAAAGGQKDDAPRRVARGVMVVIAELWEALQTDL
jgi:hypothetical protein